eukprot:162684-Chlamydomonas_euryale.AAC.3
MVRPPAAGGAPVAACATCAVGPSGSGGGGGCGLCLLTFRGLDSNTNYVTYLQARDRYAYSQPAFTCLVVHTVDGHPPEWLLYSVQAGAHR